MATTPAVGIVMRTRDRRLLLPRAIDDVLGQSFSDWCLVVVNDGGDAGEVDAVLTARAADLDTRVLVVHRAKSAGMEAAANVGIRAVESEFVAVHDDDDTWHPDFLAKTVGYLRSHVGEAAVATRTEIVWERLDGDLAVEVGRDIFWADRHSVTLYDLLKINRVVPISLLYRRALHEEIGWFDESLTAVGDWDFNLRLAAAGHIGFLDTEPLAFWHQRRGESGALGNSVIAHHHHHLTSERQVRDRYLRQFVARNGLGALLYVGGLMREETDHLDERMDHQERRNQEVLEALGGLAKRLEDLQDTRSGSGVVGLLQRKYWVMRGRLGQARK